MERPATTGSKRRLSDKVSLADVAKAADVSIGTASKALSGRPGMSEVTRQRVRDVAKQLSYVPNPVARTLANGCSGSIGLITHDWQGIFTMPIMMAAEDELSGQGVTVLMSNVHGDPRMENRHI